MTADGRSTGTGRAGIARTATALAAVLASATLAASPALASDAVITTVAGTGVAGHAGNGAAASLARLSGPRAVAPRADGGYYIADTANGVVRSVDSDGTIRHVAGGEQSWNDGDPAATARLEGVVAVSPTADGGVLIVEREAKRVAKVRDGVITELAGSGSGSGTPEDAIELQDASVIVADSENHQIWRVAGGNVTAVAGTGVSGFSGDGGAATSARLSSPVDLSPLPGAAFLVADRDNGRIRRVTVGGAIATVAGNPAGVSTSDVPATGARLATPTGVAALRDGGFLIAERDGHVVRRVRPDGILTAVAGVGAPGSGGDGGPAVTAGLAGPDDVAIRPNGGILLADTQNHRIRAIATGDLPAVAPSSDDDVAPPAPVFGDGPGATGNDTTPTWSFTAEAGTLSQCRLARGDAIVADWAPCASPHTATVASEGGHVLAVRAIDTAGNVGAVATRAYELDLTAPATPVLLSTPATTGNATDPVWQFAAAGAHSTECRLTPSASSGWTPCVSPFTADVSGSPDGEHRLEVRALDGAGNASDPVESRYILDRVAPSAPTVTAGPDAGDRAATWSFLLAGGDQAECRLTGAAGAVADWAPCQTPHTYDLSDSPAGAYAFAARAIDPAGNVSVASAPSSHAIADPAEPTPSEPAPAEPDVTPAPAPTKPDVTPLPAPSEPDVTPAPPAPSDSESTDVDAPVVAAPEVGRTAVARPVSGTVLVRVGASGAFKPLEAGASLPVGATFDTRKGELRLETALDARGRTQSATFGGGVFEVRQARGANGMVDVHLRTPGATGCRPAARGALATASARRKRVIGRLWAKDRGGRYRTHGRNSVATVRGTRWLTEERCDGTLTKVTEGAVLVRPTRARRGVRPTLVRAGHAILIPARR